MAETGRTGKFLVDLFGHVGCNEYNNVGGDKYNQFPIDSTKHVGCDWYNGICVDSSGHD